MRLCRSRMLFLRAYPRETQEMVSDAHGKAFAFSRGTCRRGICDNASRALRGDMTTAVDAVFIGRDQVFNRRLLQDVQPLPGRVHFEVRKVWPQRAGGRVVADAAGL